VGIKSAVNGDKIQKFADKRWRSDPKLSDKLRWSDPKIAEVRTSRPAKGDPKAVGVLVPHRSGVSQFFGKRPQDGEPQVGEPQAKDRKTENRSQRPQDGEPQAKDRKTENRKQRPQVKTTTKRPQVSCIRTARNFSPRSPEKPRYQGMSNFCNVPILPFCNTILLRSVPAYELPLDFMLSQEIYKLIV